MCFLTAKLLLHAGLLVYTALVVPVQLSLWRDEDVCDPFPTLYFDTVIDSFFLVLPYSLELLLMCGGIRLNPSYSNSMCVMFNEKMIYAQY